MLREYTLGMQPTTIKLDGSLVRRLKAIKPHDETLTGFVRRSTWAAKSGCAPLCRSHRRCFSKSEWDELIARERRLPREVERDGVSV
jgi:hypothetical protein